MIQAYGLAFHSPLIIFNLIPLDKYFPILLVDESKQSIKREFDARIKKNKEGKNPIVLANSLSILQNFVSEYPTLKGVKVILFDFPGLLTPFTQTFIKWLDCNNQPGGAWQLTKLKLELFSELLSELDELDVANKALLANMTRFVPKNRKNDIEDVAEHLSKNYRDLIDTEVSDPKDLDREYSVKNENWKKRNLCGLISDFVNPVDTKRKEEFVTLILDYQLGFLTKREYNNKGNTLARGNEDYKKKFVLARKWMDSTLGSNLYESYCDICANLTTRSWHTIIGEYEISPDDLLLLLSKQSAQSVIENEELQSVYGDDYKSAKDLPTDHNPPSAPYYEEPKSLSITFNF